ncbi:MAG TPA: hypothetical protein VMS98_03805 [Thermoanaerobaculia bacterium]|nr:hypothetical protein [Thermoanaerobaculia bacterium]
MHKGLVTYLSQRADAATFLLPAELHRTIEDLFPQPDIVLPQPYKIFPADETQHATMGFPLAEGSPLRELDTRLDRWLTDEVLWQVKKTNDARDRAQAAFAGYLAQLMKVAENAMMSNLLSDYHGVFWLAHSVDLARHFASIPRRVSAVEAQAGRTQGDALKYRIYSRWASETRDAMTAMAAKAAAILDGDEQRALQFFRLLQDDVLILTEEFVGPDLRELRSFITGYLRRDFQAFRDGFERLRTTTGDLLQKDRTFRSILPFFTTTPENGITVALLLDSRFQSFLFEQAPIQNVLTREDREQLQLISRRVREFAVLNQLRRGIIWMVTSPEGDITSADRRNPTTYSRSTRPLDFGKAGVVDPMVYRFGLIYDISKFSETLGNIRRGGGKEEIKSYRQMLLFQRRLETIAERHMLQFEKFLGDGAFYTTRRAIRLVRAAVEIQRYYSEMKRKGFAFNRGLRVAINHGYYRLLPMKGSPDSTERITEFYGPGIVELSRLTTGKADKEIEEIASFLVSHGYDQAKVQTFFSPLSRGVDVIDHLQHSREFYAYVNSNGHLMNEGIVASMPFLQELSAELIAEAQQLLRLRVQWGSYIGFAPAVAGLEFVGIRLLGMVSLKGLDNIEVGEVVPFAPGEAEATPIESGESLVTLLRHQFHQQGNDPLSPFRGAFDEEQRTDTTNERVVGSEIVICLNPGGREPSEEVLIGEWDPLSDDVNRPLRIPRRDFEKLFSVAGEVTPETLSLKKDNVLELYHRLSDRNFEPSVQLGEYRIANRYDAYVLGEVVEKL